MIFRLRFITLANYLPQD